MKPTTLPPSLKVGDPRKGVNGERGARGVRSVFALLILGSLACNTLTAAAAPSAVARTAAPANVTNPPYTGQFDCDGLENGLRAYSGRITVQPGGLVTFKDYDGAVQTGTWTYDVPGNTFTFSGSTPMASAIYNSANDTLIVVFVPNAKVVHTDNAGMKCLRAVPGQTGPP
jgi:hypothetical protein